MWYKPPKNALELLDFYESENLSVYRLINPEQYVGFVRKNGKKGGKVILTNVTKEDEGMYSCLVSNGFSRRWRSAFLIIDDSDAH